MSEPKWLYRLESTDPTKGLWYNLNNELVWTIGELKDCKTKNLPMGMTSVIIKMVEIGLALVARKKI